MAQRLGKSLSVKDLIFANHFIMHGNPTLAAAAAWPEIKQKKEKAFRLLNRKEFKDYIASEKLKIRKAIEEEIYSKLMSRAEIARELNILGLSNLKDILSNIDGKDMSALSDDQAKSIASIKIKEWRGDTTVEIDLWDKIKALVLLDQHLKERDEAQIAQESLIIENGLQEPDYD